MLRAKARIIERKESLVVFEAIGIKLVIRGSPHLAARVCPIEISFTFGKQDPGPVETVTFVLL